MFGETARVRQRAPQRRRAEQQADGWQQDTMLGAAARAARRSPTVPAPIYHARLRDRSAAARSRRAQRQRLRQTTQLLLVGLGAVMGTLLVVRLLASVEPPQPDRGRVMNLLAPDASSADAPRAPTATAPFIESPFNRPVDSPPISAQAALLVDMGERTVMFAKNPTERRPPGSLTKLATAIVALEQALPDTKIQVPDDAPAQPAALAGLRAGDVFTLQDLLYAMLLPAANDAAVAVVDGVGGRDYIVAQMNDLARRLDLNDTQFVDPLGLDAEGQYSTAFDLAVLASDAIDRFPLLARIVRTPSHAITDGPSERSHGLSNRNSLLWSYDGAFGVMTGGAAEGGGNFVAAAKRGARRLMVVVLDSSDSMADATTLLDFGFRALAARG